MLGLIHVRVVPAYFGVCRSRNINYRAPLLGYCVMVARETLTLAVVVRFNVSQPSYWGLVYRYYARL